MDWTALVGLLAFVTLVSWIGIAYVSKRKTEARIDKDSAPKSTLAADKSDTGKPADV